MDKNPHDFYLSDNQLAMAIGITLRSLRNRIHRDKVTDTCTLPPHHLASARGRLWEKEKVAAYLMELGHSRELVDQRMTLGAAAPPLGSEGADSKATKMPRASKPKEAATRRSPGRPRKDAEGAKS